MYLKVQYASFGNLSYLLSKELQTTAANKQLAAVS